MININKILSFKNLKNTTYCSILIYFVLTSVLLSSFLLPSIDYLTLELKHTDKLFYNYATIATLATTLPQALSLLISYLVNNINSRKILITGFSAIFTTGICVFFFQHNFIIYVSWIILCGIIFNAIYLNLSRQIIHLLNEKIKDYQSDSFLLGALGNIIGFQLGSLLYYHLHISGMIITSLLLCIILFTIIIKVKFDNRIELSDTRYVSFKEIISIILNQRALLIFLGFMFSLIFLGSGLNIFILAKIHQLNLNRHVYANLWSFSATGGVIGAFILKNPWIQKRDHVKSLILAFSLIILAYIGIRISNNQILLEISMGLFGLANSAFLINMNTTCFIFINKNSKLMTISPLINGFMMTGFYGVSLMGPLFYNFLIQHNMNINQLLNLIITSEIITISIFYTLTHKVKS